MTSETFKTFLTEKKKKKSTKRKKKRKAYGGIADSWYTDGAPSGSSGSDGGASESIKPHYGQSLLQEVAATMVMNSASATAMTNVPVDGYEEDAESKANKIDLARQVFQTLVNRPDMARQDIIAHFVEQIGVTHSTAVSYYERLAKEAGLTGNDKESNLGIGVDMGGGLPGGGQQPGRMPDDFNQQNPEEQKELEEPENPQRAGVIRTVPDAHLIYKKQTPNGTFEELWIYNMGQRDMNDELKIRRNILAGTDIPPNMTKSQDGSQEYSLKTIGNAQYLNITGLPN